MTKQNEQSDLPSGALVLSKPGQMEVAHHEPLMSFDVGALMEKAIDAKSAVEVMERLQVMRREMRAERAKEMFDASMASFQSECPIITKRKSGAKNAYKYAPLDDIVSQVRDLTQRHGFSFSITSDIESGWVKALCKITHSAGHSEVSEFKVPIDNKNPMMTDPQRYGGAMTFAKRYAFCNGFGILTADEDLDGGDKPKPQGPSTLAAEPTVKEYAAKLWQILKPVRGTEQNWNAANAWLWRQEILDGAVPETAPQLTVKRFKEVIAAAESKLNA